MNPRHITRLDGANATPNATPSATLHAAAARTVLRALRSAATAATLALTLWAPAALAAEDEAMEAMTGEDAAMAYTDAITVAIEDNWSRPASARRDMEVVLRIQLIPTGEVVSVSVLKSSGNEAFDRSAINAVNKAGRFPEVAQAPPQVFERHLRSFQLVFRPEDLRL